MNNYSGNREPFAFVLYHPLDEAEALPVIEELSAERKLYVATSLGKKEEAILEKASAALLFLSPASLSAMEEATAKVVRSEKPLIPVFLAPVTLPPGMRMLLGTTQGLRFNAGTERDEVMRALLNSPVWDKLCVTPAQKRAARRVTLAASLGVAAVLLVTVASLLLSGGARRISPDSTLGKLGLSGPVSGIKTVYLYGSELRDGYAEAGAFESAGGSSSNDGLIYLPDADERVSWGELSDLRDFAQLVNLEELSLSGNRVTELTPLYGLSKLRRLDLSLQRHDDELLSLRGIGALTGLEELNLAFTDLDESCLEPETVEELRSLPSLKRLVLSSSGEELAAQLADAPYELVCLDTRVGTLEELKAAADAPGVYCITLTGDLVIPEGEEIVIGKNQFFTGIFNRLDIRGTLRLCGALEMGMTELHNVGLLVVEDGGLLGGGMSDQDSSGTLEIRPGGRHQLERGLVFRLNGGSYRNAGTLHVSIGGRFEWNGGTLENTGRIEVESDMAFIEKDAADRDGRSTDWHVLRFIGQEANITGGGEFVVLGTGSVKE